MLSRMRNALFSVPDTASLSEVLRISSIMILPGETWIGLEHLGLNLTFRLAPGETRHGIELVAFNSEEDFAIVRSEDEEAVIRLQSREIAPMFPKPFFQLLGFPVTENIAQYLVKEGGEKLGFDHALTGNETDAELALLFLKEFETPYKLTYDWLAAPFGELPADRDPNAELVLPEGTTEMARQLAPALLHVRRSEQGSRTYRDMVITGLRLLVDPEAPVPVDAFSPEGEKLNASVDGDVVEVRSQMERDNRFRIQR